MKLKTPIFLILLITFPFCFSCGDDDDTSQEYIEYTQPECVSDIIYNYDLHLEGDGNPETQETTLPEQLTDADWGLKATVCEQAGYDLNAYAGESVFLTKYSITETCNGEPLYLWVITKDNECICPYKTVREGSGLAPGVYAVDRCE